MKHHFFHVLKQWYPRKDEFQWLLATIIHTQGSSYRKAGAMMLFNDSGEQLGVVSGGCLESDILHQARRCWESGKSRQITYDMQEEGDIAWRLGIGCGGEVTLLLQPISSDNHYLNLPALLDKLEAHQTATFCQPLNAEFAQGVVSDVQPTKADWFCYDVTPPNTLAILGGGVDAVPLCDLAARLGWRVIVNDPRARYARVSQFTSATITDSRPLAEINSADWYAHAQAVVVMHHQVTLDADALASITRCSPPSMKYLALLGPSHRCDKVLTQAGLTADDLPLTLQAPAGIAIGGELPESIALSVLAHAHAVLYEKTARPLNGLPCHSD